MAAFHSNPTHDPGKEGYQCPARVCVCKGPGQNAGALTLSVAQAKSARGLAGKQVKPSPVRNHSQVYALLVKSRAPSRGRGVGLQSGLGGLEGCSSSISPPGTHTGQRAGHPGLADLEFDCRPRGSRPRNLFIFRWSLCRRSPEKWHFRCHALELHYHGAFRNVPWLVLGSHFAGEFS